MELKPPPATFFSELLEWFAENVDEFRNSIDGRSGHRCLQRKIGSLGELLNFQICTEYPVKNYDGNGRNGRIDVVWMSADDIVFALEIDASLRMKSIQKLLTVSALHRFWLYLGRDNAEFFLKNQDPSGKIRLVQPVDNLNHVTPKNETNYHSRLAHIRKKHPRAYSPWSLEEEQVLTSELSAGRSVRNIAAHLQRQPSEIQSRIRKLGLME